MTVHPRRRSRTPTRHPAPSPGERGFLHLVLRLAFAEGVDREPARLWQGFDQPVRRVLLGAAPSRRPPGRDVRRRPRGWPRRSAQRPTRRDLGRSQEAKGVRRSRSVLRLHHSAERSPRSFRQRTVHRTKREAGRGELESFRSAQGDRNERAVTIVVPRRTRVRGWGAAPSELIGEHGRFRTTPEPSRRSP